MHRIYLDYNATCPIRPAAIDAAAAVMHEVGNASSIHGHGRAARTHVEDARVQVASLAGVRPAQVIFNSGATEGNNTILSGYRDQVVLVSAIEHPSVLESAPHAKKIPVTKDGIIDLEALEKMLTEHTPALVSIQYVNSETGVIQPVADAAALIKAAGAKFHCDAVQAAGRIALDFAASGADYMTLSGHKFGAPQGAGAVIFREGLQMPKYMHGGGQEKRQRAGTENVAAIAGFGVAAELAAQELHAYQDLCLGFRRVLEEGLRACASDIIIIGENALRVTNTTDVILPGISAETQMMAMDLEGIAASSGSACSSGTFKPSHVLAAMGLGEDAAKSALRFSTGWATTIADIEDTVAAYGRMVARVRKN